MEACERFSYYGMRAILTIYLIYLLKVKFEIEFDNQYIHQFSPSTSQLTLNQTGEKSKEIFKTLSATSLVQALV